jgi:DNA invertase Pin-like site-specific DNA recombinase
MKPYNIAEKDIFEEKQSGKNLERSQFLRLMSILREGDTLYIESYSRLSRSSRDFYNILDQLDTKGVKLISIKENSFFDNSSTGKLFRAIFFGIAEWESGLFTA